MEVNYNSSGRRVFVIPCDHKLVRDGIFYCVPPFFNTTHVQSMYRYLVVDTERAVGELQRNNRRQWIQAAAEFRQTKLADLVADTTFEDPREMGFWTLGDGQPLAMASGKLAMITLARQLRLPYFPIAVTPRAVSSIDELVGYQGAAPVRPRFTPPASEQVVSNL